MQALLSFACEARWLRHARAHPQHARAHPQHARAHPQHARAHPQQLFPICPSNPAITSGCAGRQG
jgi:hypothetical protein